MEFVQSWAPSIYCSPFWGPECLIPLQTSPAASLEAHTTPRYESSLCEWQLSADPVRAAGLGPSLQHTHTAQCYQPHSSASQKCTASRLGGWHQRGSCSQICAHAVYSLHSSCEISSALWLWLLSVLGKGSCSWEQKAEQGPLPLLSELFNFLTMPKAVTGKFSVLL